MTNTENPLACPGIGSHGGPARFSLRKGALGLYNSKKPPQKRMTPMIKKVSAILVTLSTVFSVNTIYANTPATAPAPKTYTPTNLRTMLNHSGACKPIYKELKKFSFTSLAFQFNAGSKKTQFQAKDTSNQLPHTPIPSSNKPNRKQAA